MDKNIMDKNLKQITGNDRLSRYVDSDYLASGHLDLDKDYILTIDKLWQGKISTGGKAEQQVLITFKEKKLPDGITETKPMILNATNRRTLKKLYGGDTAAHLEGKRVYVYVETGIRDPRDGGITEGLRIKQKTPPALTKNNTQTYICADCNEPIKPIANYTAEQIAATTQKRYGVMLCSECSSKRKNAAIVTVETGTNETKTHDTSVPETVTDVQSTTDTDSNITTQNNIEDGLPESEVK